MTAWGNPWTEEETAKLIEMVKADATNSQISAVIGRNKNQITGKLNRLGLLGIRAHRYPENLKDGYVRKPRPKRVKVEAPIVRFARPSDSVWRPKTCQYPVAGQRAPYTLCGAAITPDGRPYCDEHYRVCMVKHPKQITGAAE